MLRGLLRSRLLLTAATRGIIIFALSGFPWDLLKVVARFTRWIMHRGNQKSAALTQTVSAPTRCWSEEGIYPGGAFGRNYDHRHPDCDLVAGGAGRPRGRTATQCRNNLKQLSLGVWNVNSSTASSQRRLGALVGGDLDRGFGYAQPGGWIYNILPYIEQQTLTTLAGRSRHGQSQQDDRQHATDGDSADGAILSYPPQYNRRSQLLHSRQ